MEDVDSHVEHFTPEDLWKIRPPAPAIVGLRRVAQITDQRRAHLAHKVVATGVRPASTRPSRRMQTSAAGQQYSLSSDGSGTSSGQVDEPFVSLVPTLQEDCRKS